MAVVYVVQKQMRWDDRKRGLVPRFNMEPARQYGDLCYLLPSEAEPHNPEEVVDQLFKRLKDMTPDDYLLLVGNPVLIGLAAAVASEHTEGKLNFLQWNAREKRYLAVRARLFLDE